MGGSYRQMLKSGQLAETESHIRDAMRSIEAAQDSLDECTEDQTDNAEHTGGLKEVLTIARSLLHAELPSRPSAYQQAEKIIDAAKGGSQ